MNFKYNRLKRKEERRNFRNSLKIYCKINEVNQKDIANSFEVTEQEFHNMLTGYQSSIPSKGILSFTEFENRVYSYLKITKF